MYNFTKLHYLLITVSFIVIVASVVVGLNAYTARKEKKQETTSALGTALTTDAAVLEKIGKHIVLPPEQPKIVTIANVEDLRREQPFFSQANNGDKLLVYSTKVILYDPTIDKVVDIAQIRIDTSPTPKSP